MFRRKTPSELRGEQLKRTNVIELVGESPDPLLGAKISEVDNRFKKQELPRNPRYVNTRLDEVYPVRKSRFKIVFGKENSKLANNLTEQSSSLKHLSLLLNLAAKKRKHLSCLDNSFDSAEDCQNGKVQARQTNEKFSQSKFLSVTQLSSGGEGLSSLGTVDMDKALKGLVAHEPVSGFLVDSSEKSSDLSSSGSFRSEFHMPGKKTPLDFTLKTCMRVSSSVNWVHKSDLCSTYNGMPNFAPKFSSLKYQSASSSEEAVSTPQVLGSKGLHSWVYPQSTLPSSVISLMTSLALEADGMNFLSERQLAWEESFRSLYYMLRMDVCDLFYVCTSHFVVLFTARNGSGGNKRSCNAYISQSTRSLRTLLKEHDVCFSMPLCHSKLEEVTTEDLIELSEIEKHNLGQTCRLSTLVDVDNSPQSLLAFSGNKNVHSLYDFLLNYRSSLSFLTAVDVPVLYSSVPFQNAALSAPKVKHMEVKGAASHKGSSSEGKCMQGLSSDLCYIMELKDAYLPPWIISHICASVGAEGGSFEASFTTDNTSIGLNVALQQVCGKPETEGLVNDGPRETSNAFGIAESNVSPYLCSGQLKGLKYFDGSYTVTLSPIDFQL